MAFKAAHFLYVPDMARMQLEINQSQIGIIKCSKPQVVDSDANDEGSGLTILSDV